MVEDWNDGIMEEMTNVKIQSSNECQNSNDKREIFLRVLE
jgi:hypothetical protein